MKRLLLGVGALLAALGFASAYAGEPWLLPTGYPAAYFQTRNVVRFADEVAAATAGRLRIDVRPGGQHLPLAKIRPAVEQGSVPLAEFNLSAEAAVDPLFGLDALPFVTQSYEDAELLWQISRPLVETALRRRGLALLYAVPWPPQGLYANRPLGRLEDLKGLRLRSYNPATVQLARLLGAQPVEVPLVELRGALGEKRLDTLLTSATSGVEVGAWDFMKNYYDVRAWYPKNVVVANAQALAALSAEDRQALLDAAREAERRGWQQSRSQDSADRGQLAA
ncbi:MAG TPA: TRAP transporter substrate-binding protein, partial [Azospira sp.]|nr:TRAP transporter substrate-binding protein [Azospira sp.]